MKLGKAAYSQALHQDIMIDRGEFGSRSGLNGRQAGRQATNTYIEETTAAVDLANISVTQASRD